MGEDPDGPKWVTRTKFNVCNMFSTFVEGGMLLNGSLFKLLYRTRQGCDISLKVTHSAVVPASDLLLS